MRTLLLFFLFIWGFSVCAQNAHYEKKDYAKFANYDEKYVPEYTLPNVLLCQDGEIITTIKQWENKRRPEILDLFTTYMFGKAPEFKGELSYKIKRLNSQALGGKVTRKEVSIFLTSSPDGPQIDLQLYLPNKRSGVIPVFLGLSFLPNYTVYNDPDLIVPVKDISQGKRYSLGSMAESWQLDNILSHGYGLATFCYTDVCPDIDNDFQDGLHSCFYEKGQNYPNPNQWGAIAAWAWGLSRAMDYLIQDENVDNSRVAVIGHSRLGKAAVWAAAIDPRFALVLSGNSGCCGVALSKRCYGETIEAINVRFPHWFCGNFKQFNGREKYLPFDQHELVSLIAPRPIYIASAEEDYWSDQKGEFLGGKGAEPVYALYGLKGIGTNVMPLVDVPFRDGFIGYHNRKGAHAILPYDWEQFLYFADRFFKRK